MVVLRFGKTISHFTASSAPDEAKGPHAGYGRQQSFLPQASRFSIIEPWNQSGCRLMATCAICSVPSRYRRPCFTGYSAGYGGRIRQGQAVPDPKRWMRSLLRRRSQLIRCDEDRGDIGGIPAPSFVRWRFSLLGLVLDLAWRHFGRFKGGLCTSAQARRVEAPTWQMESSNSLALGPGLKPLVWMLPSK